MIEAPSPFYMCDKCQKEWGFDCGVKVALLNFWTILPALGGGGRSAMVRKDIIKLRSPCSKSRDDIFVVFLHQGEAKSS